MQEPSAVNTACCETGCRSAETERSLSVSFFLHNWWRPHKLAVCVWLLAIWLLHIYVPLVICAAIVRAQREAAQQIATDAVLTASLKYVAESLLWNPGGLVHTAGQWFTSSLGASGLLSLMPGPA